MLYVNKLMIPYFQRAPKEGLIPETYWLCRTHDILKTNNIIPKYTKHKIQHRALWIEQCQEAVPNNSIKRKSINNEISAPKYLKSSPEPKTGSCPIHLMTIHCDNKCQQVIGLLDLGCPVPVLSSKIVT
jgi:hypothetical protein